MTDFPTIVHVVLLATTEVNKNFGIYLGVVFLELPLHFGAETWDLSDYFVDFFLLEVNYENDRRCGTYEEKVRNNLRCYIKDTCSYGRRSKQGDY